ncbi:MAG: T9SS type B sorting domain-containing protein [Terrimonas sp.]|nr:T9SS type B sorting domain-containing protein [Terrimonas sp.]
MAIRINYILLKMSFPRTLITALLLVLLHTKSIGQCTALGQNPSTAFPVCGTTVFTQSTVPVCSSNDIYVPGCSGSGNASYQNKNPFWYKFTCYASGTLGFVITPNNLGDDYDWQLFDITGHNPDDVYTDHSLVVTGNWSGSYGLTGASATGVDFIQCASVPSENKPTFSKMPNLIQGHVYLLLVSHYTDSQSGYSLSFGGGSAVITDPLLPHMVSVVPDCDGKKITLKLNKKIRCNSITGLGSEFTLSPSTSTVISAQTDSCAFGFDFDEVVITLATPLTSGTHQLTIKTGSDGNTLLDNCGNAIAMGEQINFDYLIPQPILADSVAQPACAPAAVYVYYPKKIKCSSISSGGSDFSITGSTPVTISGASGNCINDLSDYIIVQLASPIYSQGSYNLFVQPGIDGSPIVDACGQPLLPQQLTFTTADTVSADFQYTNQLGCRFDTLTFMHNGNNNVSGWNWLINDNVSASGQTYTAVFPATGTQTIMLAVGNGTCTDSVTKTIVLDNEVRAAFDMPADMCPEDQLTVINNSTGLIDAWQWKYDVYGSSTLRDPGPFSFPSNNNRETLYTVSLLAYNQTLQCTDSAIKKIRVFDNCFIAVPTAFTPNGDGLNDYLYPHNAIKAENLKFSVYNRWGQLIFTTRNWQEKWDGRVNGQLQDTGVYVWFLSYTLPNNGKTIFQKGTTVLIR